MRTSAPGWMVVRRSGTTAAAWTAADVVSTPGPAFLTILTTDRAYLYLSDADMLVKRPESSKYMHLLFLQGTR
jgi:hypothetical protein